MYHVCRNNILVVYREVVNVDNLNLTNYLVGCESLEVFVPKKLHGQPEIFIEEMLDIVAARFFPLEHGLTQRDIGDYMESGFEKTLNGFFSYLKYKRFISDEDDMIQILKKHARGTDSVDIYVFKVFRKDYQSQEELEEVVARKIRVFLTGPDKPLFDCKESVVIF